MNAAIDMATGDFIGFYDHDDTLTPDALFEFVKAYNLNPKLEVIYSDEDKIDSESKNDLNLTLNQILILIYCALVIIFAICCL